MDDLPTRLLSQSLACCDPDLADLLRIAAARISKLERLVPTVRRCGCGAWIGPRAESCRRCYNEWYRCYGWCLRLP